MNMKMNKIKKRHTININNLTGETFFTSLLEEGYKAGMLRDSDAESIQLNCLKLLADKCEKYNYGESSSIKVETAESIMKSNLCTIGLYLKSLPDADYAVNELKQSEIAEIYQKGRKLIDEKLSRAKYLYQLVLENKLVTENYSYNATLNDGIETFFKLYNPDYESHECPAFIDYQLCHPVTDVLGVELILKYLEHLFLENEFCRKFRSEDIHYLLYGYDQDYQELLINIFEQVLTGALGCLLAGKGHRRLDLSKEEISSLQLELSKDDGSTLALKIQKASDKMLAALDGSGFSLEKYVEKALPKITFQILNAVKTNTLDKTLSSPVNPDLEPKIRFVSTVKMDDKEYRKIIDELLVCRYTSDKIALIKEKVKSFGDLEDLLFDAELCQEEVTEVFGILNEIEIAAMLKRHPFITDIRAVELSEAEQLFRLYLKSYFDSLEVSRQNEITKIGSQLSDDYL